MRTITSVLLLLGCALGAGAQQTGAQQADAPQTVRYIVQLQNPPALASRGNRFALEQIERDHSDFEARATASGFTVVRRLTVAANVAIVEGPAGNSDLLRGMTGVKRAFRERRMQQHFDASIPLHQIDSAWAAIPGATFNPGLPSGWNIAGQGVKIGIIDTGIDPTHPAFHAPNMTAPSGFPKWSTNVPGNQAFTSSKIIVARSYGGWTVQDVDGHGTAVASVAAGVPLSSSQGPSGIGLSGVAPAAWIGVYDVDSEHVGSYSDSDILSALEDCAADGMDVVSMSFGAPDYGGSLDPENQLYQEIFTTLRSHNVVLVASAGNDGSEVYTMASPAVDDGVIAAGAQMSTTIDASPFISAADGTNIAAASADNNTGVTQALTGQLVNITQWDSTGLGCTNGSIWPKAGAATGKILLLQRGTCAFVDKVQNAQTAGASAVVIYNAATASDGSGGDNLINMDLYPTTIPTAIANLPALFVGYNDGLTLRSKAAGGSYTVTASFGFGAGDTRQLADFSSRGPDADLYIKPDLVAAGRSVVAAWCTNLTLDTDNNQCDPFGYQLLNGTSFSAPLTAGAVALIKSARPGLTGDDYRSLIVNGASRLLDGDGNSWPLMAAGAGSLDVLQSVKSSVTAYPVSLSFGSAGSSTATVQQLTLKNVGTAAKTFNLSFEGMSTATTTGSPATLPSGATVYMPIPNLAFGDYLGVSHQAPVLWTRSVTLGAGAAATVSVQAPPSRAKTGVYEGFIDVTAAGGTTPEARIPWWYAVTASAPTRIALDTSPLYITYDPSARYDDGTLAVRFVDDTGVMLAPPGTITVTRLTGAAQASVPYQATSDQTCSGAGCGSTVVFPNVWLIDVRAPGSSDSGDTSTFRITSGNLSQDFAVVVY